jgi:hypothetical protein
MFWAFALPTAAHSVAAPYDPMHCADQEGHVHWCDGPIQPDGSWERCLYRIPMYEPEEPLAEFCQTVTPQSLIPGSPDHYNEKTTQGGY